LIANFGYDLAKEFNQFYQELPILKDVSDETRTFRLALTSLTGQVISSSMKLLGIQVPQKM
jgi:arginyl-tRNA synthetase